MSHSCIPSEPRVSQRQHPAGLADEPDSAIEQLSMSDDTSSKIVTSSTTFHAFVRGAKAAHYLGLLLFRKPQCTYLRKCVQRLKRPLRWSGQRATILVEYCDVTHLMRLSGGSILIDRKYVK